MSEANPSPERAETAVESACCGVSGCCGEAERSLDPAVTVTEAKTSAGCGCVSDDATGLPVVVVGAGPVGLAAAAHLAERGLDFVVLEAGAQ
ncbi:FAD-dependent oxidoreductase, partial [Actinomadura soli]